MKRSVVAALVVAGGYLVLGATADAVTTGPYPSGTMFIADQDYTGDNTNYGIVWEVSPGGGSPFEFDAYGQSPQDVAVDSGGDVFWTQFQDGTIDERPAGGSDTVLASGFEPTGIAVDGSGNVYFGSFGASGHQAGLYEIPSGGSPTLLTGSFGEFSSLAIDGNGDVWGVASSGDLVVVPPGTAGEQLSIPGAEFSSVSLDGADNLFAATAFGDSAIKLPPGSVTPTTLGNIGAYAQGVAVDGSGDVFVGASATVPGYGKVYEIPAGGSPSVYASGSLAQTDGIALYPPLSPASRSTSSITLTSPTPSTVTTETTVRLTAVMTRGESGGVQFDDNGYALGSAITHSGSAVSMTTKLSAGTHNITATYLGDAGRAPAISNTLTFTSKAIPTMTSLSFPSGTTVPGDQQLTVDAHVSGHGGVPTGSVSVYDNSTYEGSINLDSSGNGSLQFSVPTGSSKVYGVYGGDSTYAGSTSPKTTVTTTTPYVPRYSTYVRYSPPNGQKAVRAIIKDTVIGVKGEPPPTGTVTADDGFTCGTLSPVNGDSSAAYCSAVLPYGTNESVSLTFTSGDGNYDSGSVFTYVSNGGGVSTTQQ